MSTADKLFDYKTAKAIADKYLDLLKDKCERIEIAGSLRRQKNYIGDIELVCIPKKMLVQDGLFDQTETNDKEFIEYLKTFKILKGNPENGKYIKIQLPEDINLDLFLANQINYGLIMMIRTGSWQFSKRMVWECKASGYYVDGGNLWRKKNKELVPVPEEIDFFKITGIDYIDPSARIF